MTSDWKDLEAAYGMPRLADFMIPLTESEFAALVASTRQVRFQDATTLIFNDRSEIACIRKHGYPLDIFRPPSGLVNKGESIIEAALRESHEETGLAVELDRYLLRASTYFQAGSNSLRWTTHVFRARSLDSNLQTLDPAEIAEVRWLSLADLRALSAPMKSCGRGGLLYRAQLMEALLDDPGLLLQTRPRS